MCKKCNIDFMGSGLVYCPFCGEELIFIGIIVGMSEDADRKWRKAKVIRFMHRSDA